MKSPRFLVAAVAAGFLSTAASVLAQAPTANQVNVPPGAVQGPAHGRMMALFDNQEEFMMFQLQVQQATKGMSHDQRRAYRKQQVQQLKVMNDSQKAQWRQGLQAQWNALPDAQKNRIAQRVATRDQRRQAGAPQAGPSGQGYMDPDSGPGGSPR